MFILLALWSLAAWAFHSVATWTVSNAGGLSVAVWAVWGVGSAVIVMLGLVCSRLITVLRRRASPRSLEAVQWTP
jgi:hypothetical protein